MSLIRIITQTGPGGVITTILTYGTASYWLPDLARSELVFSAAVTGFLFMLILELLSKPAISFLSFPIILQVKRDMEKKNSQENFIDKYKGNREDLDKFDGQVFRYTCLFYSGLLASVVFGIHAYLITGRLMSLGLFALSLSIHPHIMSLFFENQKDYSNGSSDVRIDDYHENSFSRICKKEEYGGVEHTNIEGENLLIQGGNRTGKTLTFNAILYNLLGSRETIELSTGRNNNVSLHFSDGTEFRRGKLGAQFRRGDIEKSEEEAQEALADWLAEEDPSTEVSSSQVIKTTSYTRTSNKCRFRDCRKTPDWITLGRQSIKALRRA